MADENYSICCSQIIRTVLFIFNFVFWGLGGSLLVIGIYLKLEYEALNGVSDDNFGTWMYVLIIVGGVIFFIAFLGCCGTLLQSNNLLMLYFMLLILMVCGEIGCAVWAYMLRTKIFEDLRSGLEKAVIEYNRTKGDPEDSPVKEAVDSLQSIFKCCGYESRWDYTGVPPRSCCPIIEENLPHCSEATYFKVGCRDGIPAEVQKNLWLVGVILALLLILEVAGLSAGCYLRVQIVKEDITRWQSSYSKEMRYESIPNDNDNNYHSHQL